jgi:uncharacterized protein YfdQ (DUF2303 family)
MAEKATNSEAGTIAALAIKAAGLAAIITTADGREFLMSPDGYRSTEVTPDNKLPALLPQHVSQAVTLQTTDSLVDYMLRFRLDETMLFADIAHSTIVGVIDYHKLPAVTVEKQANHAAHKGTLQLPYSEEWKTWTEISGKLKPQLEFARFLEENGGDVVAPDGAELLEACRDLQANRKVNFIKAVRTSSDNECFEYTDDTEARTKGGLELPTKFKLNIPVYFGEPPTELFAFLRWKLDPDAGGLSLGIVLHRAEHVRQAVFKQIVGMVVDRTGCPVVYGRL